MIPSQYLACAARADDADDDDDSDDDDADDDDDDDDDDADDDDSCFSSQCCTLSCLHVSVAVIHCLCMLRTTGTVPCSSGKLALVRKSPFVLNAIAPVLVQRILLRSVIRSRSCSQARMHV